MRLRSCPQSQLMKHRSEPHTAWTQRGVLWVVFVLCVVSLPHMLHGQYRKWSVGASVGYNMLTLDGVDEKNQADADGWTRQGYPVGTLSSVKNSPFYGLSVSYRYDREFGVSLAGSRWSKTVSALYNGPDATLRLERGVGATTVELGIAYYPSARPYFLDWYVQTTIGLAYGHATAKAAGYVMVKNGSLLVPQPFVDTDGEYNKSKLCAGLIVGADMAVAGGFFFHADAGYRFSQLGEMDGDVTQMGTRSVQTSTIDFNFSGFLLSAGIRYQL